MNTPQKSKPRTVKTEIAQISREQWKAGLSKFLEGNEKRLELSNLALTTADQSYVRKLLYSANFIFKITKSNITVIKE